MTADMQKAFVSELAADIVAQVRASIDTGKVPATWDGVELREYLAERFNQSRYRMNKARLAEYNNAVLVNDL